MEQIISAVQNDYMVHHFTKGRVNFKVQDPLFSDEDTESVKRIFRSLHAVLYEDTNGVIRVYHPSFLDYLAIRMKEDDRNALSEVHKAMFKDSLAIMLRELRFNICGWRMPHC